MFYLYILLIDIFYKVKLRINKIIIKQDYISKKITN